MQLSSSLSETTRAVRVVFVFSFFLLITLPAPLVSAADGDFAFAAAMGDSSKEDKGQSIFVDSSGNVYTTGTFNGTVDFDPGPGSFELTSAGFRDIFVSKLDRRGQFVWARAMGGTLAGAGGNGISVDISGNVYTAGTFSGTVDFDPGPGSFKLTVAGGIAVFVSKLDSSGNYVWAKVFGDSGNTRGEGIATDRSGNVYTTGYFYNTCDFDPGPETKELINAGGADIFINKLNSSGNFVWAQALNGTDDEAAFGVSVDSFGNVYTTGSYKGTVDFDPGTGSVTLPDAQNQDIFISKLDSNGDFVWAKAINALGLGYGNAISVDKTGNIYTTGYFQYATDFDPGPNTYKISPSNGYYQIFVSKLDSSGDFVWAKAMGGTAEDRGEGISVDSEGNVYTTGFFRDIADFDPGPGSYDLTSAGDGDIFISKLDSNGDFVWAKSMGDTSDDRGMGISVDGSGNVHTTGFFQNKVDFDHSSESFELTSAGMEDIFISYLSGPHLFSWPIFLPAIIGNTMEVD